MRDIVLAHFGLLMAASCHELDGWQADKPNQILIHSFVYIES